MPPKATHRKRVSADTTHSLPVYNADDDKPPDYPDSAEEADEDTDSSDSSSSSVYVPSSFSLTSPRRRRFTTSPTHRRRQSNPVTTDPYLDSLLARSVHALEMSNTLLQSSMSTQTALSTIFADSPADEAIESMSIRIEQRREEETRPKWADDLEEISRGVDGLFEETPAVSSSLPTSSSPMKKHKRRPSDVTATTEHVDSCTKLSPSPQLIRRLTPPTEESSSSSSDGCLAKRTVRSLRKILDEQPPLPPQPKPLRAPAFLPRTPAPAAEARTSTATASITRLYTRGKHTSSTRAPSPPRQSAMKQPQPLTTPTPPTPPSTTKLHISDLLSVRNWSTTSLRSLGATSDAPSSGRSTPTPRRISFAELPEAYRGSTSARFRARERRRRDKRGRGGESVQREPVDGGWWSTWFLGGASVSTGVREERIEERLGRSWSGRMPGAPAGFGPAMDEWAV